MRKITNLNEREVRRADGSAARSETGLRTRRLDDWVSDFVWVWVCVWDSKDPTRSPEPGRGPYSIVAIQQDAREFNQPLDNWKVASVTDMSEVFKIARNFNQPLNNWNVANDMSQKSKECFGEQKHLIMQIGRAHV